MDSVTHIALGAAVGTAVLGRKVGPRAAVWGAVCATLPDLDVLLPYGDPVRDFTFHRGASHSIFWLTAASPALAWVIHRIHRNAGASFRQWLALVWLALLSHPLLDAMTVYGTQLLLPFSDYPVGVGSVFIIDPLYTVPLVMGLVAWFRLRRREPARARHWILAALAISTLYLGWTVAAQTHVAGVVQRTVAASPLADGRTLVTPAPFNSLLWRVVVMDDDGYHEGYYSLFDERPTVRLAHHASDAHLLDGLRHDWTVQRLAWFTKGFYAVHDAPATTAVADGSASTLGQMLGLVEMATAAETMPHGDGTPIVMTDLRMGQTPWFVFAFVVAERNRGEVRAVAPQQVPTRRPPVAVLPKLWQRIWNEDTSL